VRSVKSKLLVACAGFLTAITLLHTALTVWLINRHGEADAVNQLSRQLIQLQDDLQGAREALATVAQETARDDKNLSDMAILYTSGTSRLDAAHDALRNDALRDRGEGLLKTASLNRLRLVLASARLSSLAVYLDGELSHYVTREAAGMRLTRGTEQLIVGTAHTPEQPSSLTDAQDWPARQLPPLVAPRSADVQQLTITFDFPADQLLVLRVIVPIQGVTRQSFNELIVEHLTIATGETPTTHRIGQFVFTTVFTPTFLGETASRTGVLPAVLSPDGLRRLELIPVVLPPAFLAASDDPQMRVLTEAIGETSYYQAFRRWRSEGDTVLILGGALSRAGTLANIRRAVFLVGLAAGAILAIGMALGYVWITWMVAPIDALTAAATAMDLDPGPALHGTLSRYLERPVRPRTHDEIGALTTAFNAMAERLHDLIGTLEEQVRDRTSQIEAANKELESFSYSVSHDLRAPLRSLDGFSRALLEDQGDVLTGTARDYLQRIRAASQRMGQLIDDLLGLAHVSRVGLQCLHVDLTVLATVIADDLRLAEPARQVDVVIAPGLQATGDPRLLQVLLQNLLQNAWKFTSRQPLARIECGETQRDGVRTYFVRDNGVGFDMTYAHKLFGAFQRLHTTAEFPGTGIGLATVQRIVHRHGGRVWAESQVDQGATFYFTL